jgi:hypothetical protein
VNADIRDEQSVPGHCPGEEDPGGLFKNHSVDAIGDVLSRAVSLVVMVSGAIVYL